MSSTTTVAVGSKIPSGFKLQENTPANIVETDTIFKEGTKVVLFGVPGAFTPGCSKTHLPGYIADAAKLKGKGVTDIICLTVNDAYVAGAWAKESGAEGKVRILADAKGEFTEALGLTFFAAGLGGTRAKRFSAIVENGIITQLNVEPDNGGLTCSLSNHLKL